MITGVVVLTAYINPVFSIDLNCGVPSKLTVNDAVLRVIVALCGIAFAISASFACGVPGTEEPLSVDLVCTKAAVVVKSMINRALLGLHPRDVVAYPERHSFRL